MAYQSNDPDNSFEMLNAIVNVFMADTEKKKRDEKSLKNAAKSTDDIFKQAGKSGVKYLPIIINSYTLYYALFCENKKYPIRDCGFWFLF